MHFGELQKTCGLTLPDPDKFHMLPDVGVILINVKPSFPANDGLLY